MTKLLVIHTFTSDAPIKSIKVLLMKNWIVAKLFSEKSKKEMANVKLIDSFMLFLL